MQNARGAVEELVLRFRPATTTSDGSPRLEPPQGLMDAYHAVEEMLRYLEGVLDLEDLTHSEVDELTRIVSRQVSCLAEYASTFIPAGTVRVLEREQLSELPIALTEWARAAAMACRLAFLRRTAAVDVARTRLAPVERARNDLSGP